MLSAILILPSCGPPVGRTLFSGGETGAELADDLGNEIDVLFARAPIDERRPEGHATAVHRGSEEDATVGDRGFADPAVELVQLGSVLGARRPVAEAHDVERHL